MTWHDSISPTKLLLQGRGAYWKANRKTSKVWWLLVTAIDDMQTCKGENVADIV